MQDTHGGYGVTVNTGACGALDQGSIPCSRPNLGAPLLYFADMKHWLRGLVKEFETFAVRGNAVDLAVAVVIGAAFNQVTNSLVTNIITPPIGLLIGNIDFSKLSVPVGNATIAYGLFLQSLLNFVLIALALFLIVRTLNKLASKRRLDEKKPKETELQVLQQIRDVLSTKS